jgi:NADPH:quinone reductase-like Zn-dependent oxidoreductase
MKAFQLVGHGKPGKFALNDVPEPVPGPDEVVVQVLACGLNHLDLWLEAGQLPVPIQLPRTPGGEVAGRLAAVGSNVRDWKPGDMVAVQSNLFCGECEFCRRGDESVCLKGRLLGVDCDGGLAEKLLVHSRTLVRLPEGVSCLTSAALTLAGSTAMHMLTNRAEVRPGDWVLVMGASSGVGSAAIQIAKGLGGRVITTGSSKEKRELGIRLGAEHAVDSLAADWPAEVRRLTQKRGADLVVEHIGGEVLPKVFECLARCGTVVTCGATAGRNVTLNLWPMFVKQQRLIGSYGRNREDIKKTLQWAAEGKLKPVVDNAYPLTRAAEAFERLRSRNFLGKVLVEPGK